MNSAMQRDASDINHAQHKNCKGQLSVDVCGAQALWPCSMNKHVYARIDHGGFFYAWGVCIVEANYDFDSR